MSKHNVFVYVSYQPPFYVLPVTDGYEVRDADAKVVCTCRDNATALFVMCSLNITNPLSK